MFWPRSLASGGSSASSGSASGNERAASGSRLGFVGEGGIGHDLKLAMQWGQGRYDQVVAIFLLLFVTIVIIDRISDRARERLVKGR